MREGPRPPLPPFLAGAGAGADTFGSGATGFGGVTAFGAVD